MELSIGQASDLCITRVITAQSGRLTATLRKRCRPYAFWYEYWWVSHVGDGVLRE